MVIIIPECPECRRRKLEQALQKPFCDWFPEDAKRAEQELIKFSFQVKEYTKAEVYTKAKEALKKLEE